MKSKLQKARTLMRAGDRIRMAERQASDLREKLDVHEAYMRIIDRVMPKYGMDCCEDHLMKDLEEQAIDLEREFHDENEKFIRDQNGYTPEAAAKEGI